MGVIYEAACSCGYKARLDLESGLNTYNYNFVKRILNKSEEELFSKYYTENRIQSFALTNVAYNCKECCTIGSVYQLKYSLKSGEKIVVTGTCNTCNKPIEIIDKRNIICPKCGKEMCLEKIGHWD